MMFDLMKYVVGAVDMSLGYLRVLPTAASSLCNAIKRFDYYTGMS